MKPYNPFLISGYYSPEYFCDRKIESDTIINAMHNNRNITLVAPRRMGKTGLIKHVFYKLQEEQPNIVTLYIDIYSTQNLGDFVRLLANAILGKLDSEPQKAINRISKFIKSCRPVFTIDEFTGAPRVSLDIVPEQEQATLKEIFDYIASADKRCYIAIDEFQQITEYPECGVEALLRSYIQFIPNANFIFAGSKQHIMEQMFLNAKKPFYLSTQILTLGAICEEAYYKFADELFKTQNNSLPQDVFHNIYSGVSGHTWYIQNILNRLYSYGTKINEELVKYAVNEVVRENSYIYESLLSAYPRSCTSLLKAISKEGCVKEINAGSFISKYNLKTPSSVSSALKKLIDKELVYKSDKGYIVYDRFMNIWLRSQSF